MRPDDPGVLGADLLGVVARLNRWATSQARLQIPFAQARLLSLIDLLGPARISDLAAADHCSQPTMTAQLHRVAEAGWVQRTPDPHDARATLIDLTERGARALDEIRKARREVIAPQIAALPAADRARLAAAVSVLRDLTDGLPKSPTNRTQQGTTNKDDK